MNNPLTKDQIFNAYKKLKHYYYYDNSSILMREKLAKFEEKTFNESQDILEIKNKLYEKINAYCEKIKNPRSKILNKIKIDLLPKKILEEKLNIITNNFKANDKIEIERLNIYINAPIEIHLISMLWLMYVGRFLDGDISNNSYANKLELNIDLNDHLPFENFKIYKPYFVQYQEWRDDALKKAESLLDESKNVSILSLDIKDYYHNILLDLTSLNETIEKKIEKYFENNVNANHLCESFIETSNYLNGLLNIIHQDYFSKVKRYLPSNASDSSKHPLPIGLISSGFLANYYLKDFDNKITQEVNPAFYGRYVDDLMFVFSDLNQHINENLVSPTISFIEKTFGKKGVFKIKTNNPVAKEILFDSGNYINDKNRIIEEIKSKYNCLDHDTEFFTLITNKLLNSIEISFEKIKDNVDYSNLRIQNSKVILHYFDYKESRAVLNIFKNKLEEQRSEFRFLPDEDEISKDFDEEAFDLKYSDSVNKFRSIQDLSENKYGASKFLAKKIYAISLGRNDKDQNTDKQILTFFKGNIGISFYTLWEKVIIYYIIGKKTDLLLQFRRNILYAISKIEYQASTKYEREIKNNLKQYLDVAFATSLCLNKSLINEFNFQNNQEKDDLTKIEANIKSITKANLYRTSLIALPILNFTNIDLDNINILDNDFNVFESKNSEESDSNFDLNKYKYVLAPSYIPFHEVNIFKIFHTLSNIKADDSFTKDNSEINNIPNAAFEDYYNINYYWKTKKKNFEETKLKYFSIDIKKTCDMPSVNNVHINGLELPYDEVNKKIAIANINVTNSNIKDSILKKPNLNRARRKEIFDLLNKSDELNSDIIIFPEVSIPYSWLKLLAERSHKRYMAIVAGLEHWVNKNNVAFNLMVTVLPFRINDYNTSLIKVRLKNHYSPNEKELLLGYRLTIPEAKNSTENTAMSYDLFHWRKVYFSVYNCFELANIQHRSLFKSKVDFIIASELNKDTNYFSDIAGAWVRDVHSYFIQVNTSQYGDSRILQPSKSFKKDLIQVKGGLNSTVLVNTLEIKKLRDFQFMEYNLQNDHINNEDCDFKPTPPDFDRSNVLKRIDNGKF